jgi:hypothetical protein
MEKVNRLGWAAGLAFTCQGVRIGLRASTALALEQASAHLPPGWKPSPQPVVEELCSLLVGGTKPGSNLRRFSLLYCGASLVARALVLEEVLTKLGSLLHLLVAVRARRRQFVRAAVAGWGDQAILLLGPPASGRSTLLAALLRAGATYYSDKLLAGPQPDPPKRRLSVDSQGVASFSGWQLSEVFGGLACLLACCAPKTASSTALSMLA